MDNEVEEKGVSGEEGGAKRDAEDKKITAGEDMCFLSRWPLTWLAVRLDAPVPPPANMHITPWMDRCLANERLEEEDA